MSEKRFYGLEFFSYICQLAQFLCHILCMHIIHTGHMRPCIVKLFPTVISASSFGSEDCLRWRNRRTDKSSLVSPHLLILIAAKVRQVRRAGSKHYEHKGLEHSFAMFHTK